MVIPSNISTISTTEKVVVVENGTISEFISETVISFMDIYSLEVPCELIVNIQTKNNQLHPEIKVEPVMIEGGDSLKATILFPGEIENFMEFKVSVPRLSNGISIDIPALSEAISIAFDDALMSQTLSTTPLSTIVSEGFIDTDLVLSESDVKNLFESKKRTILPS